MSIPFPKRPALWVSAMAAQSLRKADGTQATADGDLVRTWRDLSGNGMDLSIFQNPHGFANMGGTGGVDVDVPLKVAAGVRSLNYASRGASTAAMSRFAPPTEVVLTGTAGEQFIRLKCLAAPQTTYNRAPVGISGYYNSYPNTEYMGSTLIRWRGWHSDRVDYTPSAPEKATLTTWHTMGLVSDPGYKELRINGVSVSSSNTNTFFAGGESYNAQHPDWKIPQFIFGGCNRNNGSGFAGEVSDVVLFLEPLTNPERVQVEAVLAAMQAAATDLWTDAPDTRTDTLGFTMAAVVVGSYTGTINLSDGGAGGSFSPASFTLTSEGGRFESTYTPPNGANGTITMSATATGLTPHDQAVTFTLPDTTPPTFTVRAINAAGNLLTLTADEPVQASTFGLALSGGHSLSNFQVAGNVITADIAPVVNSAETVTVTYTPGNIEDAAGNAMAAFSNASVTNGSTVPPDTTPPTATSATIAANGIALTVALSEPCALLDASKLTITGRTLSGVSITGSTLTATVSPTVIQGASVTLAIAAGAFRDLAGNNVAAASVAITNNSTQLADTTPPTISSVVVSAAGNQVAITLSEAVQGTPAGFVLSDGHNLSAGVLSGNQITFAVSPLVYSTETVTLGYTPGDVADLAGNALAVVSGGAVTNGSTVSPSATTETVPALSPAPAWPLSANADTVLFWQDWDALDAIGAPGGGPLSGYVGTSGGALTGAMDIGTLSGVRYITPKSGLTNYGTVHTIQFAGVSKALGLNVELIWAESTAWSSVPNGSEIFGHGDTSSQAVYRNCDLRLSYSAGRIVATFAHHHGVTPLLVRSVSATGPVASVNANTWAHIAVTITPTGDMTVWVNGVAGTTVAIPEWDTIKGFSGANRDTILGGGDGSDLRMGWKCGALKISSYPRGSLPISIPIRPKVTVDFTTPVRTQKTKLGRLHILNGAGGAYRPEIPLLRTDKFVTATPAKFGGPDANYPNAGVSGIFSYNWTAIDSFFLSQAAQGVNEIMIGSGGTHQLLGGSIAPVALSATTWSPFGFGFAKEPPTDLDLHAAMRGDAWWHLAVELGLNVTWIDWWNEGNLVTGSSGGFWLGDRATLIDLMGRVFKATKALFPAAQVARPGVTLPKFVGWSDAGWDPYYPYPGRDNKGWGDALTAALVADPQIPCDALGFHHYSGSLANFAAWRAYFLGRWEQAGLSRPALMNNETSAINTSTKNTSTGFYPFKAIPNLHSGAFPASQMFVQLCAANYDLDILHWVMATNYVGTWDIEAYWDKDGFPRPTMHVATLYHWLGQTLYSAAVVGSGGVRAMAGRRESDDASVVIVGQSLWSPLPTTTVVDVVFGAGYAGRAFRPYVIDPAHSSFYESGTSTLESIADVVADSNGVVQVPLHNWGVVGLVELPSSDALNPIVTGALVDVAGTTLSIFCSENVNPANPSGFSVAGHALSAGSRSGSTITFTIAQVYGGESLTLAYDPGNVTDLAGNPLLAFTGQAITNGSTAFSVSAVSVSGVPGSLSVSGVRQYTALATGQGAVPQGFTWSIDNDPGNGTFGTISQSGLYTAPAVSGTFTIRARSTADNTKSGTATVTVVLSGGGGGGSSVIDPGPTGPVVIGMGATWRKLVTIHPPGSDDDVVDPDTFVGSIYRNGVVQNDQAVTVVRQSQGVYLMSWVAPTTWTQGDAIEVRALVQIGATTRSGFVGSFSLSSGPAVPGLVNQYIYGPLGTGSGGPGYTYVKDSTSPALEERLQGEGGGGLDLSRVASVVLHLETLGGQVVVAKSVTIADPVVGKVRVSWGAGDLSAVGVYRMMWVVTDSQGGVARVPGKNLTVIN